MQLANQESGEALTSRRRSVLRNDTPYSGRVRPGARTRDQLLVLVIYFQTILASMFWKKPQFGDSISWCGWDFDLAVDIVALTAAKLQKLQNQLKEFRQGKKV